ncbi:linear amide C-N hydrolase [Methylocystis heyeri]|uniref:Linear amide C-N hydrolase n=1 Tax=Methylocystis heyeri TaxID=391905 RepID=A0A6B8KA03_9HYPH|nr:choloylglycine hydrolase family protein [Methylocystis heyeri]QGM44916.1 linear amide C-N hydrolase [Methylocystis heyeri]
MTLRRHKKSALAKFAVFILAGQLAALPAAQACTSFLIKAADGSPVYGRTMEFGFQLHSEAIVIPRQFTLAATGPGGKPSWNWKTRYAAVGLSAFGQPVITDGMNEKGLGGGILYFPDYVGYADPATADSAHALAPWDFLTWVLTNFATVAEVKAALAEISIIGITEPTLGITPPFHYTLHDAGGSSLVIEPVGGKLKVYDNPLGVLTNSPTFDWHMTNLRNYVKLSPVNAEPLKIDGETISSFGQGSGLLGIPGDPTPPSRFVRALGFALSAKPRPDGAQTVRLAEHILNNFDIPVGFIQPDASDKAAPLEFTQWTAIADLRGKRYYVKTYDNQMLRHIDFSSFDLNAKSIRVAPLEPESSVPALQFRKR